MARWLVLTVALGIATASLIGQDEHRDDKYKSDPHARCMRPEVVEFYPENPSLHACSCHLMCQTINDGADAVQAESPQCEMYCSKQRCACHPDDPCKSAQVGDTPQPSAPVEDGNPFDPSVTPR